MIIKTFASRHVDQVAEIENRSFTTPWPKQTLAAHAEDPRFFCRVAAEENERVAGYSISTLVCDEIHVFKIAVSDRHRRKGVAASLLSDTFDFYRRRGALSVILEVKTTNAAAVSLYRKLGFEVIRTRENYYSSTKEDAFVMGVPLERYYQKSLSTTYSASWSRDCL